MVQDFEGRTGAALVVGGSGGLGLAVVRMLAQRGADVALTYRSNRAAAEAAVDRAREWGVHATAHQLDLVDSAAARSVVEEVVATHGGLHTLVHAAGPHVPMVHLSRVTPEEMAAQFAGDASGFFAVVQPALTALRATEGSVVAITTAGTDRYPVRDGLSAAPKGAVEALVRGFAAEEGRFGVRFNAVGPGMLTDGMAVRLMENGDLDEAALAVTRGNIPMRRFGNATDIAEAVCFLASDRAGFITGQKVNVDGGYTV